VAVFRPISARHDNILTSGWVTFGVILALHSASLIFVNRYMFSYFSHRYHKCSFPKKIGVVQCHVRLWLESVRSEAGASQVQILKGKRSVLLYVCKCGNGMGLENDIDNFVSLFPGNKPLSWICCALHSGRYPSYNFHHRYFDAIANGNVIKWLKHDIVKRHLCINFSSGFQIQRFTKLHIML